jgi:hypothetical protein
MTYFEAKRAGQAFREYRDLAFRYWEAKPEVQCTGNEWMSDVRSSHESAKSVELRQELNKRYPLVSVFAKRLGVPTGMTSYPPPMIGGPVLHGDLLNCIVDQHIGKSS